MSHSWLHHMTSTVNIAGCNITNHKCSHYILVSTNAQRGFLLSSYRPIHSLEQQKTEGIGWDLFVVNHCLCLHIKVSPICIMLTNSSQAYLHTCTLPQNYLGCASHVIHNESSMVPGHLAAKGSQLANKWVLSFNVNSGTRYTFSPEDSLEGVPWY